MITKTINCPIIGLICTEITIEGHSHYALVPDDLHKMRVRSMDTEDEEGNVAPCYLSRISISTSYDFEKNDMGIFAE